MRHSMEWCQRFLACNQFRREKTNRIHLRPTFCAIQGAPPWCKRLVCAKSEPGAEAQVTNPCLQTWLGWWFQHISPRIRLKIKMWKLKPPARDDQVIIQPLELQRHPTSQRSLGTIMQSSANTAPQQLLPAESSSCFGGSTWKPVEYSPGVEKEAPKIKKPEEFLTKHGSLFHQTQLFNPIWGGGHKDGDHYADETCKKTT